MAVPLTRLGYLVDPRFRGGTSAAVAQELQVTAGLARLSFGALETAMFRGRDMAPALAGTLAALGLDPVWNPADFAADAVVLHNPSCLKFQPRLDTRIVARHLIVVAHENFLRPGGGESHDVRRCLDAVDRASLALAKSIAPISPGNRATILDWIAAHGPLPGWRLLDHDWFNICDFAFCPPTATPRDRRGRHSRPGVEKFPAAAVMDLLFPAHAEANVLLGAELYLDATPARRHWQVWPFQGLDLEDYFAMIDFMVYFTAPTYRDSFGRVVAEAVAAGKVVICDPEMAAGFGGAVVAARPDAVDAVIARFCARPALYRAQVTRAQAWLRGLSAAAFADRLPQLLALPDGGAWIGVARMGSR